MKHIHFPTLAMHFTLLLLARLTINDYPDFFLVVSIAVLTAHIIWAFKSRQSFLYTHCLGMFLHGLSQTFGWVTISNGAFGLGGGGFAWFFYGIALAVSFAVLSILSLVRWIKAR